MTTEPKDLSTKTPPKTEEELSPPPLSALEEDILTVLLGQELYGLQICRAISDASGGTQTLKVGSLYPSLHRLEKKEFVTSRMDANGELKARGGKRRKYYRITGLGAKVLTRKQMIRQNLANWSPAPA